MSARDTDSGRAVNIDSVGCIFSLFMVSVASEPGLRLHMCFMSELVLPPLHDNSFLQILHLAVVSDNYSINFHASELFARGDAILND